MTAMPSPLGRPVGADGEQTRRRIITATMRCVAEVGYAQTTIREIARGADMTSGTLYHYFPNKSELLRATDDEIEAIVLPRLRTAAAQAGDASDAPDAAMARLDAVLDESKRLFRDYPSLAAYLHAVRAQSPLRVVVAEIVEEARARGLLSPSIDAGAAVEAICALTRGLSERAGSLPPRAYDATLSSAKKLIRGSLFARPVTSRPKSTAPPRSAPHP
jgi:AcrR family transcriptional regulator